ncbi:afadin-like isoform X2 [Acanthaster planci]|uniref:Afadin-like isoform X2 n=1 Tax=Acanthaster planci TaxID=133434 RepID=A0A8B7YDS6_ACAPL|nr:afadin-like isoform X2 [Acanthaster planci]
MFRRGRQEDRLRLKRDIDLWNASRLDLFEISEPDENLEFFGVMRFFYQEEGDKVTSKCIRVSSSANTTDVINTLIEKFHPDMRMLSIPDYIVVEVHANCEERVLGKDEHPLKVQLNWSEDLREGRFLLKMASDTTKVNLYGVDAPPQQFKRKLSKREKKEQKKKEKEAKLRSKNDTEESKTEKLYKDLSKSRFTRTISNPEMVMKRQRQKKLEQMERFKNRPQSGGALKIYAHSLFPEVPYKTLLVDVDRTSDTIVKEALEKFGKPKENPQDFCLVKVVVPPKEDPTTYIEKGGWGKEHIMDDDESPLEAVMRWPESRGELIFELKLRPSDYQPRLKKRQGKDNLQSPRLPPERLPYFLELNEDGTDIIDYKPKRCRLQENVTEVGSEQVVSNTGQYLQLFSLGIQPRHCVVANMEGVVTVTPTSPESETYVNGHRIYETTMLQHGAVVRFGRQACFRFCDPEVEDPDWAKREQKSDNFETTFDVDGKVETNAGQMEKRTKPPEVLPATLEFKEAAEDKFLTTFIRDVNGASIYFKLAPTYTLYLGCRFRLSKLYRPEMGPTERAQRLTAFLNKTADLIDRTVAEHHQIAGVLAFWLANASEFLHFIKEDQDLSSISQDAQDILQECIQQIFRHLVHSIQVEMNMNLSAFLDPSADADAEKDMSTGDVVHIFHSVMTLLRRCRVNAGLTIQLFSQLFHFVGAWVFNKLVAHPQLRLCHRDSAAMLHHRLNRINAWAEKQGLELAAEAHMAKITQALQLLMAPKDSRDALNAACSQCFQLNSRQLRALLENYIPSHNERHIPNDAIMKVVSIAQSTNDEPSTDSRPVPLEEDPELRLALIVPEDGYSCEIVKNIPNGLQEFLEPLMRAGLARLTVNPTSSGDWTVYLYGHNQSMDQGQPRHIQPQHAPPTQKQQQQAPPQQQHAPTQLQQRQQQVPPELQQQRQQAPPQLQQQQAPLQQQRQQAPPQLQQRQQHMPPELQQQRQQAPPLLQQQQQASPQQQKQAPPMSPVMVKPPPQVRADAKAPPGKEPEIFTIQLNKGGSRMGLSIIAAKGVGQEKIGVYVKAVVPGAAAHKDGRIKAGDQILEVDGNSLVGLNQEQAAVYLVKTGQIVTLKIAEQGAIFHGLAEILSQPSPPMQRANKGAQPPTSTQSSQPQTRPKSEDMSQVMSPPQMAEPGGRYPESREWPTQRDVPAAAPRLGRYEMSKADYARSSPNLREEPRQRIQSDRDLYATVNKDPYKRATSNTNLKGQHPASQQMYQRSKSTSNLDPEPEMTNRDLSRSAVSQANVRAPPPGGIQVMGGPIPAPRLKDLHSVSEAEPKTKEEIAREEQAQRAKEERERQERTRQEKLEEDRQREEMEREERIRHERLREQQLQEERLKEERLREERLREERLREERLREERLREERLREERAKAEQLRIQRLREERAKEERLREERARQERAREERAREERARLEKAREERLREERAREERLREERAREERLKEERAREERLREERAREERLREERAREERLREERARKEEERLKEERAREEMARIERLREERAREEQAQEEKMRAEREKEIRVREEQDKIYRQNEYRQQLPPSQYQSGPRDYYNPNYQYPPNEPRELQYQDRPPYGWEGNRDEMAKPAPAPRTSVSQDNRYNPQPNYTPISSQHQQMYQSAPFYSISDNQRNTDTPPPPPPPEGYDTLISDFPPPPVDLPPPPPEADFQQELPPPPPPSSQLRDGSQSLPPGAMQQYHLWHEQEKRRIQEEHEQRMREKRAFVDAQRQAYQDSKHQQEQMHQVQQERPTYASLPRQGRINKQSSFNRDMTPSGSDQQRPELQRQNSGPKPVPIPRAPVRKHSEDEPSRPRSEHYPSEAMPQSPRPLSQNYDAPSQQRETRPLGPDARYPLNSEDIGPNLSGQGKWSATLDTHTSHEDLKGPSPWKREEREKWEQWHEQQKKMAREQAIEELTRQENLTPQQQEKLRKLRMEQEFQRRLEESRQENDEEEAEDEEEASKRREQFEMVQAQAEHLMQQMASRPQEDDYFQRKKEHRQLRQAEQDQFMRQIDGNQGLQRQEEEMQRRHTLQRLEYQRREAEIEQERRRIEEQLSFKPNNPPVPPSPHQPPSNDSNVVHTKVNVSYVPGPEKTYLSPTSERAPPPRNNQRTQKPPPPTQPKPKPPIAPKKFAVQAGKANGRGPASNYAAVGPIPYSANTSTISQIPMQENSAYEPAIEYNHSPTPNNQPSPYQYATPENSQNLNTFKAADTPAVIGAQEVYRDPRERLLASKQANSEGPAIEKMSFRDKMKMFTEDSPVKKTKASKWEREFVAQNPHLNST